LIGTHVPTEQKANELEEGGLHGESQDKFL
jgi:hypothetical protein